MCRNIYICFPVSSRLLAPRVCISRDPPCRGSKKDSKQRGEGRVVPPPRLLFTPFTRRGFDVYVLLIQRWNEEARNEALTQQRSQLHFL